MKETEERAVGLRAEAVADGARHRLPGGVHFLVVSVTPLRVAIAGFKSERHANPKSKI